MSYNLRKLIQGFVIPEFDTCLMYFQVFSKSFADLPCKTSDWPYQGTASTVMVLGLCSDSQAITLPLDCRRTSVKHVECGTNFTSAWEDGKNPAPVDDMANFWYTSHEFKWIYNPLTVQLVSWMLFKNKGKCTITFTDAWNSTWNPIEPHRTRQKHQNFTREIPPTSHAAGQKA